MQPCTESYTAAFWDADDWADEVDWMALHGITHPYIGVGVEAVWAHVLVKLGMTRGEVADFFPGPAFLGWSRMGNMAGPWSGPLSDEWFVDRIAILNATLAKMRSFGMTPVLPAFSGHVPCSLKRAIPSLHLRTTPWEGFNSTCFLDPTDANFTQIGTMFLKRMIAVAGTDHIYSADQFNEMTPPVKDLVYLKQASAKVFDIMHSVDVEAKWVMQGWFLVTWAMSKGNSPTFWWQPEQQKAYFSGVPIGKLIVLDLDAWDRPIYPYTEAFYGHDFVFSMIHNFGGKEGMHGNFSAMALGAAEARAWQPQPKPGTNGIYKFGDNDTFVPRTPAVIPFATAKSTAEVSVVAGRLGGLHIAHGNGTMVAQCIQPLGTYGGFILAIEDGGFTKMVLVEVDVVSDGLLNGTIIVAAVAAKYVIAIGRCDSAQSLNSAWSTGTVMEVSTSLTTPSYGVTGLQIKVPTTLPPSPAPAPANCVGVGMTPEAIHNNPAIYELATETRWGVPGTYGLAALQTTQDEDPAQFNVQQWTVGWASSRYQQEQNNTAEGIFDAWASLVSENGVYSDSFDNSNCGAVVSYPTGSTGCCASCNNAMKVLIADKSKPLPPAYPGGKSDPVEGQGGFTNATHHLQVWRHFHSGVQAVISGTNSDSLPSTLSYDYIDITRLALDHIFWDITRIFDAAAHRGDLVNARAAGAEMTHLLTKMDEIIGCAPDWLVGSWLQNARQLGRTAADSELFEFNARNQISLWGPTGGTLNDYARKQWAGMVLSYYQHRWELALAAALAAVETNSTADVKALQHDILEFELAWQTNASLHFPTEPLGDLAALADTAFLRYAGDALLTGYDVRVGIDVIAAGVDVTAQPAWNKDPSFLAFLCTLDSTCRGFTSKGLLKRDVSAAVASPATVLYTKNTA
jgi:hypothetical protein